MEDTDMKKTMFALLFAAIGLVASMAQEQEEPLTALEGTVLMVKGSDGQFVAMLKLADGKVVALNLPAEELQRLKLRNRERIKLSGVYIGAVEGSKTQARILVRTMERRGQKIDIAEPIRLTEQDRVQIRAYEEEQLRLQTQARDQTRTQDQTQAQDRTQAQDGSGSGASSGSAGKGK
jgi:hypothetical protein